MAAINPDMLEQRRTKTATRYDVYKKLALPVSLMVDVWTQELQNERVLNFGVINIYGQAWVFEGHLRWDAQGHRKPEVFGPGWTSFKKTMGFRVGYEIVFYRPPIGLGNEEFAPIFVVGVKRQIRLGGADFSGHVVP